MIDPKTFYRELDAALAKISKEKSDENFFITILRELHQKFGETLRYDGNHIFELRGNRFTCIHSLKSQISRVRKHIPLDSEFARSVLKNGNFIFDQIADIERDGIGCSKDCTPAAIYVYSSETQWIFVFELLSGWTREEITLFLNAVRTAINYRLMADNIQSEFERAAQIQKSLLPRHPPQVPGYQIAHCSIPAELVGGDFYEYYQFEDNDLGFAVGDASGHGFPAALLVRDVVIGLRMSLGKNVRLMHTLKKLNQVIQRSTYSTNFVSVFIGEMEEPGHLFYVNAGHPPPFIIQKGNITNLEASGIALGFLPEIDLHRNFIFMAPGATLVMYTDGIIERLNEKEEQFGIERLQQLCLQHGHESAENQVMIVLDTVYEYGGQSKWQDDATLVIVHRHES
ncbi:PP2C family protein-serine/threonine phosphatase [bacterium]|nr:PP2C family protein-serine/threonine phosphatase [bacterium]